MRSSSSVPTPEGSGPGEHLAPPDPCIGRETTLAGARTQGTGIVPAPIVAAMAARTVAEAEQGRGHGVGRGPEGGMQLRGAGFRVHSRALRGCALVRMTQRDQM
jgi:hypothetical protein